MKKILIIGLLLLVLGIGLIGYGYYEDALYHAGSSSLSEEDIDLALGLGVLLIFVSLPTILIHFIIKKKRKPQNNTVTNKIRTIRSNMANAITERLSRTAVKTDKNGKVTIKRPLWGNLSFILICFAFVAGSLFIIQMGEMVYTIVGIIGIAFFGGGGLLFVILMMRKPIVMISDKGITVPYGWGENFVTWENIAKIEVLEQAITNTAVQKYIGIFVFDRQGITGAGKKSQTITKKVTGWTNTPALLINLDFSFLNIQYITSVLQELHDKFSVS
ncbi:MAG: hypothetical protein FWE25_00015 [Lachnospiraceae bacterium]|nr:hypothetical protein [Lachnospiraceae bacterium]